MATQTKSGISNTWQRVVQPLLFALTYAGVAHSQEPAPSLTLPCTSATAPVFRTYRVQVGATLTNASGPTDPTNPYITAAPNPGGTWTFEPGPATVTCSAGNVCAGLSVTLPSGTANQTPYFTGMATNETQTLNIKVERNSNSCTANFTFMGYSSSEGWGDPHLTTVDGIHYDFQSAGEFTALREDGFEVQTRQSPVPTATVPITNAYTGITHCVAIYTAVAAKMGSSRVTVQPSPGAEPDPTSMQVRVNGEIVKLGNEPFILFAGGNEQGAIDGTITKHPDGVFEITDARGTQLVVASAYWSSRKVWYLNVNVYGTSAHQGTMGKLAKRSWLPALPDGSSLGPMPTSESDRYQVLYEKFADAWRVTAETSLFDYEGYGEGGGNASTEDYTRDEWPRNHPQSCAIDGQTPAEAATVEVAEQACANIVNAVRRADCVFDVMITGNVGFGKSAEVAQSFRPLPPGWYSPVPSVEDDRKDHAPCKECDVCKECPPHPWWWRWVALALALVLLVVLVLRARKKP